MQIEEVELRGNAVTIFSKPKRSRARRYPFVASIELTNLETETRITEKTKNLSLFGCCVDTEKTLPTGTKVRIKVTHAGGNFIALGRVAYVRYLRQGNAMGIAFTKIEGKQESLLENWIAELRDRNMDTTTVSYTKTAIIDSVTDIFRVCPDGTVQWLEPCSDLERAKARFKSLGAGKYVTFKEETKQRRFFQVNEQGCLTETDEVKLR